MELGRRSSPGAIAQGMGVSKKRSQLVTLNNNVRGRGAGGLCARGTCDASTHRGRE